MYLLVLKLEIIVVILNSIDKELTKALSNDS